MNGKILLIAALISAISSAAYACMMIGPSTSYSLCNRVSNIGLPGILVAAASSIVLLGGHGGGPLGMLLLISTPVNFFFYAAIGLAMKKSLARLFTKTG